MRTDSGAFEPQRGSGSEKEKQERFIITEKATAFKFHSAVSRTFGRVCFRVDI